MSDQNQPQRGNRVAEFLVVVTILLLFGAMIRNSLMEKSNRRNLPPSPEAQKAAAEKGKTNGR